jgi:hypothetical protein
MNYFIFVTQNSFNEYGRSIFAHQMLKLRLKENKWPIYTTTRHRNSLLQGDAIFFYVGGNGPNRGHILASAEIKIVRTPTNTEKNKDFNLMDTFLVCEFNKIKFIEQIELKSCLIKSGMIKEENKKWGTYLMGGIKKIDEIFVKKYLVQGANG